MIVLCSLNSLKFSSQWQFPEGKVLDGNFIGMITMNRLNPYTLYISGRDFSNSSASCVITPVGGDKWVSLWLIHSNDSFKTFTHLGEKQMTQMSESFFVLFKNTESFTNKTLPLLLQICLELSLAKKNKLTAILPLKWKLPNNNILFIEWLYKKEKSQIVLPFQKTTWVGLWL